MPEKLIENLNFAFDMRRLSKTSLPGVSTKPRGRVETRLKEVVCQMEYVAQPAGTTLGIERQGSPTQVVQL